MIETRAISDFIPLRSKQNPPDGNEIDLAASYLKNLQKIPESPSDREKNNRFQQWLRDELQAQGMERLVLELEAYTNQIVNGLTN